MINRSKRVMAVMLRDEHCTFVQAPTTQYMATLVNLSNSGALITILDSAIGEKIGSHCDIMFGGAGRMVEIRGELVRVNGQHAAFKFPRLSSEDAKEIESKLGRLDYMNEKSATGMARVGV